MFRLTSTIVSLLLASSGAHAGAPRVTVDIAPVHSLVAQVMDGVGVPELLLQGNASPHSYALRPSQAGSLEKSDIVVFTSGRLTPWLLGPLDSLASGAAQLELMSLKGTIHHDFRGDHEDHDHDHDHGHEHDGEHGEDLLDPHGWLDPENAKVWVQELAKALSAADPEHRQTYAENAARAVRELDALSSNLSDQLSGVQSQSYMALHDAFQYFDRRFGPQYAGSIALGDAAAPSPARIAKAREQLREHDVTCVFTEPQQNDRLVHVVLEGSNAKAGVLDAIGAELSPGPDLYSDLLRALARSFADCLAD